MDWTIRRCLTTRVTINSGSFTADNGLSGALIDATNLLAAGQSLAGGASDVYTLTFNVSLDAAAAAGTAGSAGYVDCASGNAGNSPDSDNFALYNVSGLDANDDGTPDTYDDACEDLPVISHEKLAGGVVQNVDGTYTVTYTVTVTNAGAVAGTYGLDDTPLFDDAVTINSGSFTADNGLSGALIDATNLLAAGQSLAGGASDVYTLTFNVSLDAAAAAGTAGSAGYVDCANGNASNNPDSDNFALYNVSGLDANDDGTPDTYDDACEDLPVISHEKSFVSVTPNMLDGTYAVVYTVTVTNSGAVAGTYGLDDTPLFDDDITINSGSFSLNGVGSTPLLTSGTSILTAPGTVLGAGQTDVYELTFIVTIGLNVLSTDGGDNIYVDCDNGNAGNTPDSDRFALYNVSGLDLSGDGEPESYDDDCGDLPLFDLALDKNLEPAPALYTQGSEVVYTITVTNQGEIDASNVEITDTPEDGLVFDRIEPQSGITGTGGGSFIISALPVGGSVTVTLNYTISDTFQGTTLNNAAEITEDGPFEDIDSDPETGPETDEDGDGDGDDDDEDDVDLTVEQTYDLALTKTLTNTGDAPFMQGDLLTYTITVTNEGSLNAANVVVTDTPGTELSFVGSDVSGTNVTDNGDETFTVASLAQGASVSFEVTYQIDPTFQGTSVVNDAQITEDDGDDEDSDPDTGDDVDEDGDMDPDDDDEDEVVTPVEQTASIDVEKATFDPVTGTFKDADIFAAATAPRYIWSRSQATPVVNWEYVVTNTGTLDLINVVVTDDIEGVIGTIPFLAAGASETLTASAPAQETDTEPYRNVSTAVGQPVDENGDPTGDTVDDEDPSHYLGIVFNVEKVADQEEVCAGDLVTYTATVRLSGQSFGFNARMVMVEDNMVEGVSDSFVVASDANGNGILDFANGMNEEWMYQYTIPVSETTTNVITEMFDIYFEDDFAQMVMGEDDATVTVFDVVEVTAVDAEVDGSIDCFNGTNGSAVATVTSGTAPFTYEWSAGVPVGDGSTVTQLGAGTYTVTVTDANGCTAMTSVTLEEPSELEASIDPFALDCFGDMDGVLTVEVTGGTEDYTITWNTTPVQTGATATGLAAGTYTATIVDANGCETSAEGTVTQPDAALTASIADAAVDCFEDTDGVLTVVVTGGTEDYTITWNTTPVQSGATATGLAAGTYTATIVDANGCETSAEGTITEPAELTASIADAAIDCFEDTDGVLTVVVTGGTEDYTITWNTTPVQSGTTATGLAAGTYTATIVDANGCETSAEGTITEPTELVVTGQTTDVDCNGEATGTITLTVTGGTPDYTYAWTGAGVVADAMNQTGLAAGDYSVVVADANGCVETEEFTIEEASSLEASIADAAVDCFEDTDGVLTVVVTGGTEDYTITWNTTPVQTGATATGLAAGTYTATIVDANGCETSAEGTITEPAELTASIADAAVDCFEDTDGVLTVVVTGGTEDYTITWNTTPVQSGTTATGLAAGTYTATIVDANGCETSAEGTITEPAELTASIADAAVDCFEDTDGVLTVVVTGGTEDYTITWNMTPVQSGATATGLAAGTYTATVVDANGCETSAEGTITEPTELVVSGQTTDVDCNGEATGTITLTVTGGTPDYTYAWTGAGVVADAMNQTGLAAGDYSVVVTDANGCVETEEFTIEEASSLEASIADAAVDCFEDTDGVLTVVVTGGTEDYTITWNTTPVQTGATATGLAAGTYTATIVDANGCETSAEGTITEPAELTASIADAAVDCFEDTDGVLTVVVTGGTEDYTITWNTTPVQSGTTATGLAAGTYTATIVDVNGCETSAEGTITEPAELTASIADAAVDCFEDTDGVLTVVVTGGTEDYTITWNTTPAQSGATATGLAAGTYTATIVDANGCTETATGTVNEPTALTLSGTTVDVECNGAATGSIDITVGGGTLDYTYAWSNGATTEDISGLTAGVYSVTVTDANGCMIDETFQIDESTDLEATVADTDVLCFGDADGTLTVVATGGTPGYTYLWSDGQTTATATGLVAGTYTVTVTDANGCIGIGTGTVNEPLDIVIDETVTQLNCNETNTGSISLDVNGGTGDYTYNWSGPGVNVTAQNQTGLEAGTYTVVVTDENNCSATETYILVPASELAANIDDDLICPNTDQLGSLTVSVGLGSGNYSYSWNTIPEQTTATATDLEAGTYTIVVIDLETECSVTVSGEVIADPEACAKLGDYVWYDANQDGIQDDFEFPVGGLVVQLFTADNTFVGNATTGADGFYLFEGLAPGDYYITSDGLPIPPVGQPFTVTIANAGVDSLDSDILPTAISGIISLEEGECDLTNDIGFIRSPDGMITAPCVCLNDATTAIDGRFEDIIDITGTPGDVWTIVAQTGMIALSSPPPPAAQTFIPIGTVVPAVPGEPGVYELDFFHLEEVGYSVTVQNLAGQTLTIGNVCAYPTIEVDGVDDEYCLLDEPSPISIDTDQFNGTCGELHTYIIDLPERADTVEVNPGNIDPQAFGAGEYEFIAIFTPCDPMECANYYFNPFEISVTEDCEPAGLGDFVWFDSDLDGVQDPNEPGVENITVNLKDENGNIIATTTTDETGFYSFTMLAPGAYSVQFDLPDGFNWTTLGAVAGANEGIDSDADPAMNGMTEQVTIVAGEFYPDLDAGITPSCDLEAEVTIAPVCNDAGTPTDPSDDFYTVTILVSGTSPTGEWASSILDENNQPITGQVNVPTTFTLPAVQNPADIMDRTVTFVDLFDVNCAVTATFTPLGPCSNECALEAAVTISPYCDDNGTDFDPEDDRFFFGITVTSINQTGSGWTAFGANDEVVGTGLYGEETDQIGPFTIEDLDDEGFVTITVRDNEDGGCAVELRRFIPEIVRTCSDNCAITATFESSFCDSRGTWVDASDDVWYAYVYVNGFNGVTRWTSTAPGGQGTNTFGLTIFGPFTNFGGTQTIEITNINGGDCGVAIVVEGPEAPCSDECGLDGEILSIFCDDNGTPSLADTLDDVFFITVTAEALGNNSDEGWQVREGYTGFDPIVGVAPVFGQVYTFGPFPIYDENGVRRTETNFRIEDADYFTCRVDTLIQIPEPCSDEFEECDLEIIVLETICDNQDTPFNGSDDTYDFVLLATGATGTYTIEFMTPAGLMSMSGTFGVEETFGPIPANSNVNGTVVPDDVECTDVGTFFVQAHGTCTTCRLEVVTLEPETCDDQGTTDPSDDTYTVTVEINNQEGGAGYLVDVPGIGMVVGLYSTADTIRTFEFPILDENGQPNDVTLIFRDLQFPDVCFAEVTFNAPESCSPCDLTATIVSQTGCDPGTDIFDPSDDTFTVTVLVTGENTSGTWVLAGTTITGSYGIAETLTFPAGTEDLTLEFADAQLAGCTDLLMVSVPETCVTEIPCELEAEVIAGPECSADGEGYAFTVLVTNTGGSENGWIADNGATGLYGTPVTIEVADACAALTVIFTDAEDVDCTDTVTVNTPGVTIEAPADVNRIADRDLICDDGDEIFNQESSLAFTGDATVTGCGIESVDFEDVYLDEGAGCADVVIERTFTVTTCSGATATDVQLIIIRKPLVTDVTFPSETIEFDCEGDTFPVDENGNPATSVTGVPTITTAFGDAIEIEEVYCGTLTVAYSDEEEQTCSGTRTIIRTWTATDACSDDVATGTQIIRTGDFSPPVVTCPISNHYCHILEDDIMLFPMDYFDCVANFDLPLPDVVDVCSDSWTILTEVIDADGAVVITVADGEDRSVTLEAGDYTVRYTVTDDCGNTAVTDCVIRVADTQEPAAICISNINVSVGGYGLARVYAGMIDLGSYDNCGLDSIVVRRQLLVDPVTGDSLEVPTWTAWEEYAEVDCNDAGSIVTLQLRVVDAAGNANICTTEASVVDNTLPYCIGLEDLFLSCSELPADFDATDTLSLQANFGVPQVVDNCAADAIELMPIVDIDDCMGTGTIVRRWLAVDQVGNVSALEFRQTINITADMGFTLVIPRDTLTECLEEAQGFDVIGVGCADVSVSYQDVMVETTDADGDACLVIERTYLVVNNCTFDPASDEVVEISRDEDCDGEEGESVVYAIVTQNSTFIDVDTDFTNTTPEAGTRGDDCDGETNPTGILRATGNTGAWTYTQRIAIIDNTRPELIFAESDVFCATEMDSCLTMVEIPITVSGECTAVGANWLVLVDLGRDGSAEMRLANELAVEGEFPHYFIRAELPIGEHNLMLRYVDGCNNAATALVPFEVVDCSIPDPVCYSGLITNLAELETPDTLESGEIVEVGVTIDAGLLAGCDIDDCSGPLRFSVNRKGETPSVEDTTILLTCADRYQVELEVYMWDNAFNPMAVQPDSSIGGPNWTMCLVEVFVQDPDMLCEDCSADGSLTLGGRITTPQGIALPNVEVELSGDHTAFQISGDAGNYSFTGLPVGGYGITPYKEDDAGNGISTTDELILQQHLLGNILITDPYVWMAADLNGSGTITVIDRLLLRNVILGNTDVLPNSETWRFVPADYLEEVAGELDRFANAPHSIKLSNVDACSGSNHFIGIKLGDLNNSVFIETASGEILNGTRGRSSTDSHQLEIEERRLQGGEFIDLPVLSGDLSGLAGLQFTLAVGPQAELVEVVPGLITEDHLGLTRINRGVVSANWTQPAAGRDDETVLFTLRLRGVTSSSISEVITLNNDPTYTEAYSGRL